METFLKARQRRSIELSAAHQLISETRLEPEIIPLSYILDLRPILEASTLTGSVRINISASAPVNSISLHSHFDMVINVSAIHLIEVSS